MIKSHGDRAAAFTIFNMDVKNPPLVLCSTARLARSLRLMYGREQRSHGKTQWQPLAALTLDQWLQGVIEEAVLRGNIAADAMALNRAQELMLWERVIERMLPTDSAALFDRAGLARTALEANRLMLEWNISIPPASSGFDHAQEVEQFLQWQAEFRRQCRASGWLESVRHMDWQIAQIRKGAAELPQQLFLAGYDRISPQEQRLFETLKERGVEIQNWPHLLDAPPSVLTRAVQIGFADSEAECRAAVAWAAARLSAEPEARLAIVAPELESLRERLTALLDDTLHPAAVSPAMAQTTRSYDFSLGAALSRQPIVAAALDILNLAGNRRHISQQDFSKVLLGPYWSANSSENTGEADARAQLDARMRAHLPLTVTLERVLRFINKQRERGLPVRDTGDALGAFLDALPRPSMRQLPSLWSDAIRQLLGAAGWPGRRSLSSHEYQAKKAFDKTLDALAAFDMLTGPVNFAQAVQRLGQVCTEEVFQPESADDPQVLVMGMLETVGAPLDMWVMGMNDHIWPPAAHPNPLLPAALQRAARAPNADGPVQAEFAQAIHQRLLKSAHEIVFSWAHKSGDSELRVSPLLQGITPGAAGSLAETLAEKLAYGCEQANMKQHLDDHLAPLVGAGEKISGGAGLIKAQAVCPAWAYYRYRLGARPLEEPIEGLDSMDRGNLVHAVLQSFWQGRDFVYRDSAYLDQPDETLNLAIASAIDEGVARFSQTLEEPLPPKFLVLEKQRLQYLLSVWLAYEKKRPPFTVEQCEQREVLQIAGIDITLVLDRVDRLQDGKLVVIDYKTGSSISHDSWAVQRISEPQLPIYSSLVLADEHIAAVCFAQVRADEQRFVGIAAEADTLPGIKALHEAQKLFPPDTFPDWIALLDHWKSSIEAIANELVAGEAAVVFADENDLRHCEVLPLLRLPERDLQLEAADKKLQEKVERASS
jgi:probable DNA repair protein